MEPPCPQRGHLPPCPSSPWMVITRSGRSRPASSKADIHELVVPKCRRDGLAASQVGVSPSVVTALCVGLARIEVFSPVFATTWV